MALFHANTIVILNILNEWQVYEVLRFEKSSINYIARKFTLAIYKVIIDST